MQMAPRMLTALVFRSLVDRMFKPSLTYGDVFGALERVTRILGRKVNPTVYTLAELSKRSRTENALVTRVIEEPKLWVIGSEHDLPVAA